jgi:peptidoglycan/xylan/chitin deacetylase (PgdA/CDA1 family)
VAPPAPDCSVLRCVALTFDDGPGPYTAALLDELAARGAPATFFVVGRNVARYPDLVAREVAAGHAVGNHSWDHHDLTTLPPDGVAGELDQTSAAILAAAGVGTALVRPPYGATSDQVTAALAARGDAAIFWSVDTEDWKNRNVGLTTRRALAGAAPGAIILMHDIHPTTVQAVPGIIDALRAAGYTLVTVPQILPGMTGGGSYRHG